nr:hypothetical protein [Amycolatopsis palatopharyngis]
MWITDAPRCPGDVAGKRRKRSDLAGHASYGYCASNSLCYWGVKLYLACTGDWVSVRPLSRQRSPLRRS